MTDGIQRRKHRGQVALLDFTSSVDLDDLQALLFDFILHVDTHILLK